jgi:hypothetical protein
MKKTGLFLVASMLIGLATFAQKTEVLYFKADLACCQARACNALEGDVKAVVEKNFNGETVVFKEIKLADPNNKELIEKYNAKSQTVVIVTHKKKKETFVDVTDIVRNYSRFKNKEELEKNFVAKINESMK